MADALDTILLDPATWDLALDADGDIAVATKPYAQAQDAASACRTFLGECYWDVAIGVPYLTQIFGHKPSQSLLKALFAEEGKGVPGVSAARCFLTELSERRIGGQIQVTVPAVRTIMAANFTVVSPQGVG